jgi:hypothetical protein
MITKNDLIVFEHLKVHNINIEPSRVKANYSLLRKDGQEVTTEFIYTYDSHVFNNKEYDDVNLASMMLVQVAMNYGLFCKEIIFDGLFDSEDRKFITDMMENTSREIYVNKFLSKNEFLKSPFDAISHQVYEKYTACKIQFINSSYTQITSKQNDTAPDYNKYGILSSGGKDSLLTYGIISEIGEPHPIFINESGRHWFTAVNAYNYIKSIDSRTAKPWCNSDRVFNWMLRHMPFIKENFQNIRADMYPVRLWTVAVFVFGTLPLIRKRGIGNVLIGNEYDCTLKSNFNGITHYNSLYDQSKYFDNALTRYYKKKGWHLRQYSILRSLSELLILKILVKRYPDLQAHQVSCHAAHSADGRMHPCGKCEKCRRIIGMLIALDENPSRCGYSPEQISYGLQSLQEKKVKQIGSDAAHLFHLLKEKKAIEINEHTTKIGKPHPQIMKLRFDKERSNMEDLPVEIRKNLFAIFSEYSDGVAKMEKNKWVDGDLGVELNKNYFLLTK